MNTCPEYINVHTVAPRFSALEIVPFLGLVPFSCNVRKRHYFKYNFEYNATAIRHQHSIQRFERGANSITLIY